MIRRREFISLLWGASALLPIVAVAQQPPIPLQGFLNGGYAASAFRAVTNFRV
jgi:hypothetical protein